MAVYFPRGQQRFADIRKKFVADFRGVQRNSADGMAFVTNQEVSLAERAQLKESVDGPTQIYHLERVSALLDQPSMALVRSNFLLIDPTGCMAAEGAVSDLGTWVTVNAQDSGFLQVGRDNLQINVSEQVAPAVHSGYRQVVYSIAPSVLEGRGRELAELAEFCIGSSQGGYLWWQAPAWAGKSALMSWFALNPPARVRIVSFFVTARYSNHDRRHGFVDVILEQLAELLGESMPAYLSEATREVHFLDMLARAAQTCMERDERLVLLVDGLDEDGESSSNSIAALLPSRQVPGLRVVIAGRPDPPIPADVPDGHCLRDPSIVRILDKSPQAQANMADGQRDLKRLLKGEPLDRDLLGLITAAIGGLTLLDLVELTGCAVWQIEETLRSVSGRTFTRYPSRHQRDSFCHVYALGHVELQVLAAQYLAGASLDAYRQRLHTWAKQYRERRWPADTPQYLLDGYYGMLQTVNDLPRMVAYAVDRDRHDRMLNLTGGDAAAFAEISTAELMIIDCHEPDLLAMVRLAIHRGNLVERNANMPERLVKVWAELGDLARAEALARSLGSEAYQREEALGFVAEAAAAAGNFDQAMVLVLSIAEPFMRVNVLIDLVKLAAAAGDVDQAMNLVCSMPDQGSQVRALGVLVEVLAADGDLMRVPKLLSHAEALVSSIFDDGPQVEALRALVEAAAAVGDLERVARLAVQVEVLAQSIPDPPLHLRALGLAVEALVAVGDFDQAESLARSMHSTTYPAWQCEAFEAVAEALVAVGDFDRAESLARLITESYHQVEAFSRLVEGLVAARDVDRAETLARSISNARDRGAVLAALVSAVAGAGDLDRAETLARSITNPHRQLDALANLVEATICRGDLDRAETLAYSISYRDGKRAGQQTDQQANALVALAVAVAAAGDFARAETLVQSITEYWQVEALATLAETAITLDDLKRASRLAAQAETMARSTDRLLWRAEALISLIRAVGVIGHLDRAEAIVESVIDPSYRGHAVAALAEAVAVNGDLDRAATLVNQAEIIIRSITELHSREKALIGLVRAVAAVGDLERAETLARSITHSYRQFDALIFVLKAAVVAGEVDRAAKLFDFSVLQPSWQAEALAVNVEALAVTGDLDAAVALSVNTEKVVKSLTSYVRDQGLISLARAVAAIGDHGRAEKIANSITEPDWQAEALAAVAKFVEPNRAAALIARALHLGSWVTPLDVLAHIQSAVVVAIADEFPSLTDSN